MTRFTLATFVTLMTASAHAATTLTAGPFYSGPSGASVVCRITNYHDSSVPVTKVAVLTDTGLSNLATTGCQGTNLAPNASCAFVAPIPQPPANGYVCKASLGGIGSAAYNRLTEQLVDSTGKNLVTEPGH